MSSPAPTGVRQRLRLFFTLFDSRFEDLTRATWRTTLYRDFSAGLVVAMTAIPMAMGFAMAMGLRPEQGIIAGALACIVGRTFGGSKYQVYGPTAAFIPVIAALMSRYGEASGGTFAQAHGFLVLVSLTAGVILMGLGLGGLGRLARRVPSSIVVGFTVGIGVAIAVTNLREILGLQVELKGNLLRRLVTVATHLDEVSGVAVLLAAVTFLVTRGVLRISPLVPAPLFGMGTAAVLAATAFRGAGVATIRDRYGSIPSSFFVFTPPSLPAATPAVLLDAAYFVVAIVFVSAIESLLCSSMADRLARNTRTPFDPDKELWGQGLVQIVTPLVNGFPCTGALARTATSIKAGAVTPLAGYFKGVLKLALAVFLARWLELVPMACIGGVLVWVATNMIKPAEIREVARQGRFHTLLMVYTAVMVPMTDFLTGVLSALVLYAVAGRFFGERLATARVDPAE